MIEHKSVDVAVITRTALEQAGVIRHLDRHVEVVKRHRTFHRARLVARNGHEVHLVVLCLETLGALVLEGATAQIIDVWNPRQVVLTGVIDRAGIPSRLAGNLVVADLVVAHGTETHRPSKALLDVALDTPLHEEGVTLARPVGFDQDPLLLHGLALAGRVAVRDPRDIAARRAPSSQIAQAEMRGYELVIALYEAGTTPGLLMVEAVCASQSPGLDLDASRYCADLAGHFLAEMIRRVDWDDSIPPPRARRRALVRRDRDRVVAELGGDWVHLADYFDVPPWDRQVFEEGHESTALWGWMEKNHKLDALPTALGFIGRAELAGALVK